MKALIQRVQQAQVWVDSDCVGAIEQGLLVFVGIDASDTESQVDALADRLLKYRVFADGAGKMNLNVQQVNGGVLLVSQFTLSADTQKGLRPGFSKAAKPDRGRELFDRVVARVKAAHAPTETGRYGADMKVHLINDGPVTFLLETTAAS